MAYECVDLDLVEMSECKDNDFKLFITFKKGSTIREAKRELYQHYVGINKQLDVQLLDAQLQNIKKEVKLERFIGECEDQCNSIINVLARLDLDLPDELFRPPMKVTAAKATELYKKLIMAVATKVEDERIKKEKEERNKEKRMEKLGTMKPTDVFDMAVQQSLEKKLKMDPNINYAAKVVGGNKDEWVKDTSNDAGKGKGQMQGKGKGQGKGKEQGKGKGKGQGQWQGKNKGKGKGKGKSNKGWQQQLQQYQQREGWPKNGFGPGKGPNHQPYHQHQGGKGSKKGKSYGKGKKEGGYGNGKKGKGAGKMNRSSWQ